MGIKNKLFLIFAVIMMTVSTAAGAALAEDIEVQDAQRYPPATNVPVVYVEVDDSSGSPDIAAMNASEDHSVTCEGRIMIDIPKDAGGASAGFPLSDEDITCIALDWTGVEIRGRGNSTWRAVKKPYKIKLEDKKALLGETMGANKHWVLLANYYDRTLLKDRITARLGADIGMAFTPRGVPVELMMKNASDAGYTYYGSYYLSEQVRVAEARVNIKELKESDSDDYKITGGYLIQNGMQTSQDSLNFFETKKGEMWANHTPDFDETEDDGTRYENDKQKDYIRGRMQAVEDALYAADYSGSGDSNYRNLMDLESAAKYWLVMQASLNPDAYDTGSTYLYKDRGDPLLYWGPLWDFDYAWNYDQQYDGFQNNHKWVRAMLHDTAGGGFVEEVQKQWNGEAGGAGVKEALLRLAKEDSTGVTGQDADQKKSIIDEYYGETLESQLNDLWLYPYTGGGDFVPESDKEKLKTWILKRVDWMDKQINDPSADKYIGDLSHLVIMKDGDEELQREFLETGWTVLAQFTPPQKEGYIFTGWEDGDGNEVTSETTCTRDMVIIPKYVSKEDATKPKDILLQYREYYAEYSEGGRIGIGYTIVPEDVQDKEVVWKSSDESVASVDECDGEVVWISMKRTGDAVITAVLSTGYTRSLTVHITDYPLPAPDSVRTEKEVYEMTAGSYDQILLLLSPARSHFDFIRYNTSDESVVTVNDNGALKAIAPGRATVRIVTETIITEPEWHTVTQETACEVVVSEKKDDGGAPDDSGRGGNDKDQNKDASGGDSGSGGSGGSRDGGKGKGADTGDDSALPGWIALITCSSAALAAMIRRRRT